MTGAELTVRVLKRHGVDTVFGLPGAAVLSLYDALYLDGEIRHILCTHEEYAGLAAGGYARASGRPGVVLATSGPGATNLVTALADAYMDSVPVVAITGNVPSTELGKDSFQEIDIAGVTMPITKHNMIVKSADELEDSLVTAFEVAMSGRHGPVLVDITSDCFDAEVTDKQLIAHISPTPGFDIGEAVKLISESRSPIICAGGGVIASNASGALAKLAEMLDCPVAVTNMGVGSFPASHPRYAGRFGMQCRTSLAELLRRSDLLIACGLRFNERLRANLAAYAEDTHILHIDIDRAEISKVVEAYSHIRGDAREVLEALCAALEPRKSDESFTQTPVHCDSTTPGKVFEYFNSLNDDPLIYTTDVGLHQLWAVDMLRVDRPRSFITSGGLGAMGFGLPAAIGACAAFPASRAVVFSGDGSFSMSANELITALREGMQITVVLFNNASLGMVRYWQHIRCKDRFYQTSFDRSIDFSHTAAACGARYYRIGPGDDPTAVLNEALRGGTPSVVECITDRNEYI